MNHKKRGMTMVEMTVAMIVLALCSVAVQSLLTASLRIDSYLQLSNTAVSELDMSARRIAHNLRSCAAAPTAGASSLSLTTQPDPNFSNASATVSYAYNSSTHTLSEIDSRYGTNVIVNNVTAFTVAQTSASPLIYQITINVSIPITVATPTFSRSFRVRCRNF